MSAILGYVWRKLRRRPTTCANAMSATIVGQSTAHARRIAGLAIAGAAGLIAIFVLDRLWFSRELQAATGRLVLADERLTMSAAIGRAVALAPADSAARFNASTKVANDELVELERRSFAAAGTGDLPTARALLESSEYAAHKMTLTQGTQRLIAEMVSSMNAQVATINRRTLYSLADAARAGLATAEALTPDFEAGGTIMECDGRFLVMPVTTDNKRTSLAVLVYAIPGCTLAGLFHTHPKREKLFSAVDIAGACALKTRSYMKPRDGKIRVFDCSGMSEAAQRVALTRPMAGTAI